MEAYRKEMYTNYSLASNDTMSRAYLVGTASPKRSKKKHQLAKCSKSPKRVVHLINTDSISEPEFKNGLPVAASSGDGSMTSGSLSSQCSNDFIKLGYVNAKLDPSLPSECFKQDIIDILYSLEIPGWSVNDCKNFSLDRDLLTLTKIKGALTNVIYKIHYPNLPSLLLRIFGDNIDSVIDREYELEIIARLSLYDLGPKLEGYFQNGRFEKYIEGSRTSTQADFIDRSTSIKIAKKFKELHSTILLTPEERSDEPSCWTTLDQWINMIDSHKEWITDKGNISENLRCSSWDFLVKSFKSYKNWLHNDSTYTSKLLREGDKDNMINTGLKMVFCHNDLQHGNLLFACKDGNVSVDDLIIIDFEYAGANPVAFDLSNHMNEWMHNYNDAQSFKSHTDKYPKEEDILTFAQSYINHMNENRVEINSQEVKNLYNLIIEWRPCAQLYWCLWALLQSGKLPQQRLIEDRRIKGPRGDTNIATCKNSKSKKNEDDSFNYLGFCKEKMSVFWGDLITMGIIDKDCLDVGETDYLETKFLS
ncbi:EKI1-like protein [Saccharomyces kudriavzevii IFO 1802]|uniref:EKI1-like protein n=2 Tax=Saccharomyces kudriavzevii (strain ATCC MYA-4449 / AS 2.2408 / CBS 8840 / NBRC 1802 / NCYC 2889) TaxID=226230 RepID=J5PEH8_SACK1|nr:EKI1-like protein [Saccharomyces kudriavzevii IFO 1802]